jgi:hypothetical protein
VASESASGRSDYYELMYRCVTQSTSAFRGIRLSQELIVSSVTPYLCTVKSSVHMPLDFTIPFRDLAISLPRPVVDQRLTIFKGELQACQSQVKVRYRHSDILTC